jgi:dienelactone hydrolase
MSRTLVALVLGLLVTAQVQAAVKTKTVEYKVGDETMKGFIAWDDKFDGKRPGVMVVHEWWGLDAYTKDRARQLAELGYVAIAADMYGEGKVTEHPDEAKKFATMVRENQKVWMDRALAGLKQLKEHDLVDANRLAAIGYCFGGSTVQLMAYNAPPGLKAVVSFHGALVVPKEEQAKNIKAKVLICHGEEDKFIPEKAIKDFKSALDQAKVDYQFKSYAGAVHSFTVPDADKKGIKGIAYHKEADQQSWQDMQKLFKQVFAN